MICVWNVQFARYSSIRHSRSRSTPVFVTGFCPLHSSTSFSCYSSLLSAIVFHSRTGFRTRLDRYTLCPHKVFPLISLRKFPCFNGSPSSTFAGENMKFRISPLSLITRCSLNPKNHPMEHFPRVARPSKVL